MKLQITSGNGVSKYLLNTEAIQMDVNNPEYTIYTYMYL